MLEAVKASSAALTVEAAAIQETAKKMNVFGIIIMNEICQKLTNKQRKERKGKVKRRSFSKKEKKKGTSDKEKKSYCQFSFYFIY